MRIVFAGTPDAAVPSLTALHEAGHDIAAVVTRPDAPLGRRRVLTPSPVAQEAERLGLPVIRAARLDEEATERLAALGADLGVIVAYGGLVREPLLSTPPRGWINLHFSLLPRWRGAAPVQHALIAGDAETGAAVFQLVEGLDAGDLLAVERVVPGAEQTAGELLAQLAGSGAGLLRDAVAAIARGEATPRPQEGEPTLAPKLTLSDGLLDWTRPADEVHARYRGTTPEPGAHTTVDGARLKVLAARRAEGDAVSLEPGEARGVRDGVLVGTATEPLLVTRVQPAGKGAMAAADWLRGARGDVVLGS
ncbi:methionyl-tRNA formyltransferase [Microbacterium sp. gxy059]|uniref:methionyl-tRNA formyltransferase n=1 Tax=Microbacterium sp. gxy059 TaxID=2957199 RepID=UPI003D96B930